MAWPNGMELVTVTVGSSLSFFGDEQAIKVTVTPVIGGTVGRLLWAATGHPVVFGSKTFTGVAGTVASFTVPNPDQPGFIDGAGNAVTNWAYSAVVEVGSQRWTQAFQPVAGQSSIDLDMVQDGQVSAPVSAPVPAVTSVNGQTGAVVVSGGGGEGGPVAWTEVLNKPSVFPPAAHQHSIGDVTGLQAALDAVEGVPGEPGADGAPGADGQDGADGLSAYQLAAQEGFVGTLSEWFASLKGADGAPGADGQDGAGATIETLPAGIMLSVRYDATNDLWPVRPTQRTDISVYWYGGAVKPADMLDGDVWVTAADAIPEQPADTEAPSVPAGMAASNITHNSFTLNWSASTDDTGVTGYEVLLGADIKAAPSGTTATISGLAAETTYPVSVRARDAANNWSALSDPINVTTASAPPIGDTFSVFGSAPHPGTLIRGSSAPITRATAFYTFGAPPVGWRSVGMRIYIPAGVTVGTEATCYLWNVDTPTAAPVLSSATRTATMTGIAAGQWNEVMWEPEVVTPGQYFWVGYSFSGGEFVSCPSTTSDFILSTTTGNLVQADGGSGRPVLPFRSFVNDGVNGAASSTQDHFGIDCLIDKGAV